MVSKRTNAKDPFKSSRGMERAVSSHHTEGSEPSPVLRSHEITGSVGHDGRKNGTSGDKKRNKLEYHRSAVACSHCRRRKIRCRVSTEPNEQRCHSCARLRKECRFYPVDQTTPIDPRRSSATSKPDRSVGNSERSVSLSPVVLGGQPNESFGPFRGHLSPQEPQPIGPTNSVPSTSLDPNLAYGYHQSYPPESWQHSEQPFHSPNHTTHRLHNSMTSPPSYWPHHETNHHPYLESHSVSHEAPATYSNHRSPSLNYNGQADNQSHYQYHTHGGRNDANVSPVGHPHGYGFYPPHTISDVEDGGRSREETIINSAMTSSAMSGPYFAPSHSAITYPQSPNASMSWAGVKPELSRHP